MSTNWIMNKQTMVYLYIRSLLRNKEPTIPTPFNTDESHRLCRLNKDAYKSMLCDPIFMKNNQR